MLNHVTHGSTNGPKSINTVWDILGTPPIVISSNTFLWYPPNSTAVNGGYKNPGLTVLGMYSLGSILTHTHSISCDIMRISLYIYMCIPPKTYFFRQTAIIVVFCSELDFDGILETCKYQRKCTRVNHI